MTNLMDREVFELESTGYPVIGGGVMRGRCRRHALALEACWFNGTQGLELLPCR